MTTRLPPAQVALLEAADAETDRPITDLAGEADLKPEAATRAAFELEDAGLVTVTEEVEDSLALTAEGERYREEGLPELRLYEAALAAGADREPAGLGDLLPEAGLDGDAVDIALANFARKGYGEVESGSVRADPDADPGEDAERAALEAVAAGDADGVEEATLEQLERRDLLERTERTVRLARLTDEGVTALMGGVEAAERVDRVTPELLTSGEWAEVEFAEYNVEADAEQYQGGREHILRQTANRVKDVLVGMGFEEMEGPHVDAQFWINDCLFMPQDHPARTHWDQFALERPDAIRELPEDLVERVRSAHLEGVGEDGEGYHSPWALGTAKSLDLRGHTTSLSMRYLSGHQEGELEPPQRYFSVEKVYRNDTLDPTHLLEFFQIEGWVMAEDLSVRDLMGTFEEFYDQFGITDLEFKPHYNPYTEPSFELFGTHPETGELVEVGNSGIFRDEVTEPLGVEADVMAWGLSLERLLMLIYGFEDIRDVHGTLCDLDLLRNVEVMH
ncbi:phenylalanine--tRNA ligase subunit alpha [Salinirussus salinus]|jgi:phenylalanyl-tRNA synthetase alpha chain|uniref:phenylalanine--tRNA ligase subunit alpha n=1 Tax=Salinirussus salinus TaxID=1198300 RepID=UPI001359FB5A|nr:phenylalanine--tRNA ligase subunit alpha [Salinirussus salinus]